MHRRPRVTSSNKFKNLKNLTTLPLKTLKTRFYTNWGSPKNAKRDFYTIQRCSSQRQDPMTPTSGSIPNISGNTRGLRSRCFTELHRKCDAGTHARTHARTQRHEKGLTFIRVRALLARWRDRRTRQTVCDPDRQAEKRKRFDIYKSVEYLPNGDIGVWLKMP